MRELVRYLLENMYLDFQGEISLETVRQFLRTDDSQALARQSSSELPYWNGAELGAQLDSPLMQPWLPAALRQNLSARAGGPQNLQKPKEAALWLTRHYP